MKALHPFPALAWILSGIVLLCSVSTAGAWRRQLMPWDFGRYPVPMSIYGWPLGDKAGGYYGGMRYREYYAFSRGYGYATFPDSLPNYPGRLIPFRKWPYPEWLPPVPGPNQQPPPNAACIIVNVPRGAIVWLDGKRSRQIGNKRTYYSPNLPPNQRFVYQIRARWNEGILQRDQTQSIIVSRGRRVSVQFPRSAAPQPVPLPMPRLLPTPKPQPLPLPPPRPLPKSEPSDDAQ